MLLDAAGEGVPGGLRRFQHEGSKVFLIYVYVNIVVVNKPLGFLWISGKNH